MQCGLGMLVGLRDRMRQMTSKEQWRLTCSTFLTY